MRGSLGTFWDKENGLTTFLWMLILFVFVFGPISHLYPQLKDWLSLVFAFVLISGIWATFETTRTAWLAICFTLLAVSTSVVEEFFPLRGIERFSAFCDIPVLGLLFYVVFKQTMKDGPVTMHRVKGGVASYLVLGILWAKLYSFLEITVPNSFSGITSADPFVSLVYFSFVTLTTLGYGDILPVNELSRTLVNAEAIIGQLFPAVFIARLVGLEIEQRRH